MDSYRPDPFTDPDAPAAAQRARQRDSIFVLAKLRFVGEDRWYDIRVRNLSPGGLMAELARVVEPDTAVELDIRGIGEVGGKVAWCTEGRMGIALDRQIDPHKARKPVTGGTTTPEYTKPILFKG